MMARNMESQYRDLLNPVKDPEKSFQINLAQLLQDYVSELHEGRTMPNFNSAALLLQGSASIYSKKVEYLHNLATQLHQSLLKQKKDEQHQARRESKEKEKKEAKIVDLTSVEIKIGKNLSCLRRSVAPKNTSKKAVKKSSSCIPVHLLSADNEDRGDVFYDTRGEPVGNKGDYALNKCNLTDSGWLLLPSINPNLVPSFEPVAEFPEDAELFEQCYADLNDVQITEQMEVDGAHGGLQSSPDEGLGSCPPSNEFPLSTPETDVNLHSNTTDSPAEMSSVPPSTDEGIGDTPENTDDCHSPGNSEGNENVPTSCGDSDSSDPALKPVRHSVRQALKPCQLALEDDPLASVPIDKNLVVRKKIQKKNTRCLPNRLKMSPGEEPPVCTISEYCARTFFAMDGKNLKNSLLAFDVNSFDQNSKFMKRVMEKIDALKSSNRKNKTIDPIEDEREIDVEGIECLKDADEDDESLRIPFDDSDIRIENDPAIPRPSTGPPPEPEIEPITEEPSGINQLVHEECKNYLKEVHNFVQNSDITVKVHEWEKSVKPFLDELERRESFDINLYGSRILNAFEDSNRKQTMTFRQFCQNKEKWEIHRYFMALLPLANIGNVSIESEHREDGSDEIFVTLLSRKMHHKELEEFGHNDGSHS